MRQNSISSLSPSKPSDESRLPSGLLRAFSQNMHAWEGYTRLPESERAALRTRAAQAHSQKEISLLLNGLE